jgi:hypothetical protein
MPDYLADREKTEKERFVGIASDGRRWVMFERDPQGGLAKVKETTLDPEKPEAWIGGSLQPNYVSLRQDIGRVVRPPPPGTRVFFVLRPLSLLADGTRGKMIVAERKYEAAGSGLQQPFIHDIPLMRFEASGFEVYRDGKMRPLLLKRANGSWAERDQASFPPDLKQSMLSFLYFEFTRQDD